MISGITENGFVRPDIDEIETYIKDIIEGIATDASGNKPNMVAPEPWGVILGLGVRIYDDFIQNEEDAYYAQFLKTATGADLDRVAYPSIRLSASQSEGTLTFTGGTSGGTISKDEVFETEDGRQYSLDSDLDLNSYGEGVGAAHSILTGVAQNAPIGAVRFIPTPISGMPLLQVTNASSFLNATDIESDTDFRARAIEYNSLDKTSSLPAMDAALRQVSGVNAVLGYENLEPVYDTNGVPPGGIVMTVRGGDDTDIATSIYNTKPAGNPSWGDVSVLINDPTTGLPYTMKFSRVTNILIYVSAVKTVDATVYNPAVSDDIIKEQILQYIGGVTPGSVTYNGADIGENIFAFKAAGSCFELSNPDLIPGLEKLVVLLGTSLYDITHEEIDIDITEEAYTDFDSIYLS